MYYIHSIIPDIPTGSYTEIEQSPFDTLKDTTEYVLHRLVGDLVHIHTREDMLQKKIGIWTYILESNNKQVAFYWQDTKLQHTTWEYLGQFGMFHLYSTNKQEEM